MAWLAEGVVFRSSIPSDSSPLHWAAGGGHDAVVELLLSKGARVNARNRFGKSAATKMKRNWIFILVHNVVAVAILHYY